MATRFGETFGDATFNVATKANGGFWDSITGTPVINSTIVNGNHLRSTEFVANSSNFVQRSNGFLSASGRININIYLKALPTSTNPIFSDSSGGFGVLITSGGILKIYSGVSQIGTNGATLSIGQWYRICLAYTITSTSVNQFRLFVNSVSSISISNATLSTSTLFNCWIGNQGGDTTLDFCLSDLYIDDSNSLTDTGNILTTAKRPVSNGTTNGFTTQIGSGGSGYGSGHAPQVNERPLSTTNGWSIIGTGSAVTEEYNIEGQSVGDINITGATIVDYIGWVDASSITSESINIIINGNNFAQTINSTATVFLKVAGSTSYPAGSGTDIGIQTSTTMTTVGLYECGIIVFYIPPIIYTIVATQGSYILTGFATALKKYWKIILTQGSYTLTGFATTFNKTLHIVATQGSYILTGFAATLNKQKAIVANFGSYIYSGIVTKLTKIIKSLSPVQGSYSLTGESVSFIRQHNIFATTGYYIYTGFKIKIIAPIHDIWNLVTVNTSSWKAKIITLTNWSEKDTGQ